MPNKLDPYYQDFPSELREYPAPTARMQWKGTDCCADIYCKCGEQFHFDGYGMYHIQCGKCGQVYQCNPNIELIPIQRAPKHTILLTNASSIDV